MSLFQSLSLVVFASLLSQGAEVAEKLDKIMKTEVDIKYKISVISSCLEWI